MEMNKRGMYFTLMTIAFLSIFIFVFMVPSYKHLGEKMTAVEMRIDSMNDFIKSMERDTERGLYVSSFRAILSLQEYVVDSGKFVKDFRSNFTEALLEGNISDKNASFMKASTFTLWIEKMEEEALNFNIIANITLHNITVYQNDPWHVGVSANLSFSIRDSTNLASWNRSKVINTSISIISFEDPLYIINTYGRTTNLINSTQFENNYTYKDGDEWKSDNLLNHTLNSYYSANPNAPNFIMRYENNLNPNENGIESLVNLLRLADVGLEVCDTCSIVDHYYFQDASGNYRVNHTPSWFRLDNGHRAKYQVTAISCHVDDSDCMSGLETS